MKKERRVSFFLFFVLAGVLSNSGARADTFFGEAPTGFLQLDNFRYPVYLLVPQTYDASRPYPLILALPDEKDSPEAYAKEWADWAKKKGYLVLVPTLKLRLEDVPYGTDEWLLNLKKEITGRYNITPDRIYLIGEGSSAHYAAYLGVNYPAEFSAVGLVEGSWPGPLEKLLRLSSRPIKQNPFFVAISENSADLLKTTEAKAYQLTKKGYPVYLERIAGPSGELSPELRDQILEWLEKKANSWLLVIKESERSWKEKFFVGVEEFFIPSQ